MIRLLLALLLVLAGPAGLSAQEALTRIAFGSCADQDQPQPIWDAVMDRRPQLFIFAGDNVYGDVQSPDLRELRRAYATASMLDGYNRLRRSVPHMAVWDDHDYGLNDGGASFAFKAQAKELFLDFWNVPADDARRQREGLYTAAVYGPVGRRVQVILLDTRWFRSPLKPTDQRGAPGRERYVPDPEPTKTMRGPVQWQWLEAQLRQPAELRLIVSTIQVLAEGHGWERWGNLPIERQRLFDLIGATRAQGVVLLSGDRHLGALYRETVGTPYALTEITSSGINKTYPNSREAGPNRLGAVYGGINFGTIEVDWPAGSVELAVRGRSGEIQRQTSVRLNELMSR